MPRRAAQEDLIGVRTSYAEIKMSARFDGFSEFRKKFICDFFSRSIDQSLSELRQLAADLSFDIVCQQCAVILVSQRNSRSTFGEAGNTALASPEIL